MVKASSTTTSADTSSRSSNAPQSWRPTTMMNMRDLSKDDDFLSHLLVEKLGTGAAPLVVHKMDPSRRLPKTDAADLLRIVHRLVFSKLPPSTAIRRAVDEILLLRAVQYYIKDYTTRQVNAFASHAQRYFELYQPTGMIEIAHTSRYAHRSGKSELCILATRDIAPGTVIQELKGSMADLTDDECRELKRTDLRSCGDIRRDFSVIHSKSKKKNHLFLGPARFVNHDCGHNCELIRETRCIAFRVIKPIAMGEEVTAHYGMGYFGRNNRHCLCATCEKYGRGGYSATYEQDMAADHSDSDCDTDISTEDDLEPVPTIISGLNERRTRRKTYPMVRQIDSEDSGDEVAASLVDNNERTSEEPIGTPNPQLSISVPSSSPSSKARSLEAAASRQPSTSKSTPSGSPRRSSRLSTRTVTEEPLKLRLRVPQPAPAKEQMAPKEDSDTRVRRNKTGASTPAAEPSQPKKERPIGKDGKPLPICSTCENVLPLIAVDSQVVWGLLETSSKGKQKKQEQECPRCMRHSAIYRQPWPSRIPLRGSVLTPEPSPPPPPKMQLNLNKRSLPTIDQKLSAAAKAQSSRNATTASEEPPQKRRRIEASASAPIPHSVAVAQLQSQAQPKPYRYPRKNSIDPATGKPKRGRPRNRTPDLAPSPDPTEDDSMVKMESDDEDEAALLSSKAEVSRSQPREGNGRFGKKQREMDSRAERASERERKREEVLAALLPANRGAGAPVSKPVEEDLRTIFRPLPRSTKSFGLLLRPNPMSFSRKLWRSQDDTEPQADLADDASHSEDSDGIITPSLASDAPSPLVVDQEMDQDYVASSPMKPFRVIKPSPFGVLHKAHSSFGLLDSRSEIVLQQTKKASDAQTIEDVGTDYRTKPIFSALHKTYALPSHENSDEWMNDTESTTITSVAAFSTSIVSTRFDKPSVAKADLRPSTPTQDQYDSQARLLTIVEASPTVQLNKAWVSAGA